MRDHLCSFRNVANYIWYLVPGYACIRFSGTCVANNKLDSRCANGATLSAINFKFAALLDYNFIALFCHFYYMITGDEM